MLAFGIAALIFSVIAIFVPGFGIMISGISGVLAWISVGKATPLGAAAVIVNFVNIFLLSPGYMLAAGLEASQRTHEESKLFTIWAIVLFIQIGAVVVFIFNLALDSAIIPYFEKRKCSASNLTKRAVFEKIQSLDAADNSRQNIPAVTKVLIHKIHGGRKQDSKFWSKENDITVGEPETISIVPDEKNHRLKKARKVAQTSLYPLIGVLIVVVTLIIARPDLMPFLDYHNIYSAVSGSFPNSSKIEARAFSPAPQKGISSHVNTKPISQKSPTHAKPPHFSSMDIPHTSVSGKLFSWRDENGIPHFSNTNFPTDNPTLQVQSEINRYNRVTKISIVNNQIYIPVTLQHGDKKITRRMLLDTGSSHTVIPYEHLNYLNCKYGKQVTSTLADGSKSRGRKANIDSLKVGSVVERNVTVTGAKIAGSDNTGLLGLDFLKYHPFKIDFENKFLIWM